MTNKKLKYKNFKKVIELGSDAAYGKAERAYRVILSRSGKGMPSK